MEAILSKDPLAELTERDKKMLWSNKLECLKKYPNSLPKLLQAVNWCNKLDVVEVFSI